jgi:tetratricopeptide (TPR) repeat protein
MRKQLSTLGQIVVLSSLLGSLILGCGGCGNSVKVNTVQSAAALAQGMKALADKNSPDLHTAIIHFDEAIQNDPQNAEALFQRGLARSEVGNVEYAIRDLKTASSLDQVLAEKPELHLALGKAYLGKMDFLEAIESLSYAIRCKNDYAEAYYQRSIALAKSGDKKRSNEDYGRACNNDNKYAEEKKPSEIYAPELPQDPKRRKTSDSAEIQSENPRASTYCNTGNDQFARQEYLNAVNSFTMAIRENPRYAEAYCKRGEALLLVNKAEEAIESFNQAIKYRFRFSDAYLGRGDAYMAIKNAFLAKLDYTRAIEYAADPSEAYRKRGRINLDTDEYDLAIEDFTSALRGENKTYSTLLLRALAFEKRDDWTSACDDYKAAIKLNPDSSELHCLCANALIKRVQAISLENRDLLSEKIPELSERSRTLLRQAVAEFGAAIESNLKKGQHDPNIYCDRAAAYELLGQRGNAVEDVLAAIERSPDDARAYLLHGMLMKAGLPLDKAVELKPDSPQAFYARGVVHLKSRLYNTAIDDFSAAIRLDPKMAFAYRGRGDAMTALSNYKSAEAEYGNAIRLKGGYCEAYCQRAQCLYLDKKYYEALADCNIAIQMDPKSPIPYNLRGCIYIATEAYDEAIESLRLAADLTPENARYLNNLGVAYEGKKDYRVAENYYTQSLNINPVNQVCLRNRGRMFLNHYAPSGIETEGTAYVTGKRITGYVTPTQSVVDFKKYSELQKDDVENKIDLALALYKHEYFFEAADSLIEALKINPKSERAHRFLNHFLADAKARKTWEENNFKNKSYDELMKFQADFKSGKF